MITISQQLHKRTLSTLSLLYKFRTETRIISRISFLLSSPLASLVLLPSSIPSPLPPPPRITLYSTRLSTFHLTLSPRLNLDRTIFYPLDRPLVVAIIYMHRDGSLCLLYKLRRIRKQALFTISSASDGIGGPTKETSADRRKTFHRWILVVLSKYRKIDIFVFSSEDESHLIRDESRQF